MKTAAFTYDYVCLPPDKQIGKHSQATWELVYVVCGTGIRTIGDKTEPILNQEIILIPPYIPHGWNFDSSGTDSQGNIENIAVFFESSVLDGMEMVFPETRPLVNRLKSLTKAVLYTGKTHDRISRLLIAMRDLSPESRFPKMLELLALISNTDSCRCVGINNLLNRSEQRLEKTRVFCACNFARDLTLKEAAAYVGMNKSAFCRFMRRNTGKSFSEYLNDYRLEKAAEMLRSTDERIADIAYDVGFPNVTYFNRLFKSRFGYSPRELRIKYPLHQISHCS